MIWLRVGFAAVVILLRALDLGVFHRKAHAFTMDEAPVRERGTYLVRRLRHQSRPAAGPQQRILGRPEMAVDVLRTRRTVRQLPNFHVLNMSSLINLLLLVDGVGASLAIP